MQMDQITQQNAALVEEAASAAKSLEDQADSLTGTVAFFRTGSSEGAHAGYLPARPHRDLDTGEY